MMSRMVVRPVSANPVFQADGSDASDFEALRDRRSLPKDRMFDLYRFFEHSPAIARQIGKGGLVPLPMRQIGRDAADENSLDLLWMLAGDCAIDFRVALARI